MEETNVALFCQKAGGKFSELFHVGGGAGDVAIITDDKKDLTPLPSSTLMESDVYSYQRKTPSETDTLGGMMLTVW